jgi:hypothetical protein
MTEVLRLYEQRRVLEKKRWRRGPDGTDKR